MTWTERTLLVLLLVFTFVLGCFDMSNADIWWHLRTGRMIWERGEVPKTDWFTYTNPDSVWLDLHWGFQVVVAAVHDSLGVSALILLKCTVATAAVWLGLSLTRGELPAWLWAGLWVVPLVIMGWRYNVRPEMFSIVLLMLTLKVLDLSRTRPKSLWALPYIQVAWVNVQGLFVLQYVVVGAFLAEQTARRWLGRWRLERDECRAGLGTTTAAVGTMCVASLVNPYFWRGVALPVQLMGKLRGAQREFFLRFSGELHGFDTYMERFGFRATFFSQWTTMLILLLFVAVLVSLIWLLVLRRISVYRWLLFLSFVYLAWRMTRNAVLFGLVGGVVLSWNVADLMRIRSGDREPRSPSSAVPRLAAALAVLLLVWLIASIPLGSYFASRGDGIPRRFGLGQARWYCHDLADIIRRSDMPRRIYASHLGMAAVCIFHSRDDQRIFVDARLETNRPEVLRKYRQVMSELIDGDEIVLQTLAYSTIGEDFSRDSGPMLVFDTQTLLERPTIVRGILASKLFRCIYAQFHQVDDLQAIREGVCIFIPTSLADKLELPAANIEPLLRNARQ